MTDASTAPDNTDVLSQKVKDIQIEETTTDSEKT